MCIQKNLYTSSRKIARIYFPSDTLTRSNGSVFKNVGESFTKIATMSQA